MFGRQFTLFKMFDFAVRIDLSWLIIVVLVIWTLAGGIFPEAYKGLAWGVYLVMGIVAALALFSSILFHELCHSLVARRYGLPMKGITLFIFGGVAEMGEEPSSPRAEFMMAIAGPLSSVLVALVFWGAYAAGRGLGWPVPVTGVLRWIAGINAVLVAFNMIPGFPLDGGRVLRSILWHVKKDLRAATRIASKVGAAFGTALIALGIFMLLTGNAIGGLWPILIGVFLRAAARSGYRQVLIRQALQGESLRRFMNDQPVTVSPDLTLDDLVEDYIYHYHFKMFPVVKDDMLVGCISTRQVREVPRDQWSTKTVGEVADSCVEENTIGPDEDAVKALSRMSRGQNSRLMVVDQGRLVGILTLKDLLRFLALKMELEHWDSGSAGLPPDATET